MNKQLLEPLTDEQAHEEWDVEYQTRIGNLAATADPTPKQKQLAGDEADAWIAKLRKADNEGTPQMVEMSSDAQRQRPRKLASHCRAVDAPGDGGAGVEGL